MHSSLNLNSASRHQSSLCQSLLMFSVYCYTQYVLVITTLTSELMWYVVVAGKIIHTFKNGVVDKVHMVVTHLATLSRIWKAATL